jgi:catechol 2,3-dioxygenase-like lactoylglutathione lyase family enzyme
MKEQLTKFSFSAPILPSLNFRETIDFYTHRLGFRLVGQYPDYLIFDRDSVSLHFWFCEDANIPKVSGCYIYVQGIAEIYQDFEKQGVIHPNSSLQKTNYGLMEFAAVDSHGNLLRIGEIIANHK